MPEVKLVKTSKYITRSPKFLRLAENYSEIRSSQHKGCLVIVSDALKTIGNMKQKDITEMHQELIEALRAADNLECTYLVIERG